MPGWSDLELTPYTDDDAEMMQRELEYNKARDEAEAREDEMYDYLTQQWNGAALAQLFPDVLAYVRLTNDEIRDFGTDDELIPEPVELVSLDSYCKMTCFAMRGAELRLIKYDYQPWHSPGGLYEPPDEGIEFDWYWL